MDFLPLPAQRDFWGPNGKWKSLPRSCHKTVRNSMRVAAAFVRGSAHCIIYANLNFALDGTRGTLPLPFSQFFWNLVLWNSWSLLILRYGSFVIFYNVLFTMWSDPTQPPLIVLIKLGHMWEQLLWLTHIFGGKNFPQLWSFGQALKFHIRNILMNHLKRWNTTGYRSKEAPIIWQSHCQWPTSFGHLRPDFTAKPIAGFPSLHRLHQDVFRVAN